MHRRVGSVATIVAAAGFGLVACTGSSHTTLPTVPSRPFVITARSRAVAAPTSTATASTASAYVSAGEKHDLLGGTIAASYPKFPVRPPKGGAEAPAGAVFAVVEVKLCASKTAVMPAAYLDPSRFRVEVPGQGLVEFDPAVTPLRGAPPAVAELAPGACAQGTLTYLIRGEQHIESVVYDMGDGTLRWAS